MVEQSKPPILEYKHPQNALDAMRTSYRKNRIAMQLEGLAVTDETSSYDYWSLYEALSRKIKNN